MWQYNQQVYVDEATGKAYGSSDTPAWVIADAEASYRASQIPSQTPIPTPSPAQNIPEGYVQVERTTTLSNETPILYINNTPYAVTKDWMGIGNVLEKSGKPYGTTPNYAGTYYAKQESMPSPFTSGGNPNLQFIINQMGQGLSGTEARAELGRVQEERVSNLTPAEIKAARVQKIAEGTAFPDIIEGTFPEVSKQKEEFGYLASRVGESQAKDIQAGIYTPKPFFMEYGLNLYADSRTQKTAEKGMSLAEIQASQKEADILATSQMTGLPYGTAKKLIEDRASLGLGQAAAGTEVGYEKSFIESIGKLESGKSKTEFIPGFGDISFQEQYLPSEPLQAPLITTKTPEFCANNVNFRILTKGEKIPTTNGKSFIESINKQPKEEPKQIQEPYKITTIWTPEGEKELPKGAVITKSGYENGEYVLEYYIESYIESERELKAPFIVSGSTIQEGMQTISDAITYTTLEEKQAREKGRTSIITSSKDIQITTPSDIEYLEYTSYPTRGKTVSFYLPISTGGQSMMSNINEELDLRAELFKKILSKKLESKGGVYPYLAFPAEMVLGAGVDLTKAGIGATGAIISGGALMQIEIQKLKGEKLSEKAQYYEPYLKQELAGYAFETFYQPAKYYAIGKLLEGGGVVGEKTAKVWQIATRSTATQVEKETAQLLAKETTEKVVKLGLIGSSAPEYFTEEGINLKRGFGATLTMGGVIAIGELGPKYGGRTIERLTGKVEEFNPFQKEVFVTKERLVAMKNVGLISEEEALEATAKSKGLVQTLESEMKISYSNYQLASREASSLYAQSGEISRPEYKNVLDWYKRSPNVKPPVDYLKELEMKSRESYKAVKTQQAKLAEKEASKYLLETEKLQSKIFYLSTRPKATSIQVYEGITAKGVQERITIETTETVDIFGVKREYKTKIAQIKPEKEKMTWGELLKLETPKFLKQPSKADIALAELKAERIKQPVEYPDASAGSKEGHKFFSKLELGFEKVGTVYSKELKPSYLQEKSIFKEPEVKPSSLFKQPSRGIIREPSKIIPLGMFITSKPTKQPSKKIVSTYKTQYKISEKQPVKQPSKIPTKQPTILPSREPTRQPSKEAIKEPIREPSREPTRQPSKEAIKEPIRQPLRQPIRQPLRQPIRQPLRQPIREPLRQPIREPLRQPIRQVVVERQRYRFVSSRLIFPFGEEYKGIEKGAKKSKPRGYSYSPSLYAVSEGIRGERASKWDVMSGIGVKPMIKGKTTEYGQPIRRHKAKEYNVGLGVKTKQKNLPLYGLSKKQYKRGWI